MFEPKTRHLAGQRLPANLLNAEHQQIMAWADNRLGRLEPHVAKPLAITFLQRYGRAMETASKAGAERKQKIMRSPLDWLVNMAKLCEQAAARFPLPVYELRNDVRREMLAVEWAGRCKATLVRLTASGTAPASQLLDELGGQAKAWHFTLPALLDPRRIDNTPDPVAVEQYEQNVAGVLARLLDEKWWQRRIERAWTVYCELIAILTGQVRRGVSVYASHHAVKDYTRRKAAQRAWMEQMSAVNDELGEELDLVDAIMASVANPEIRRHELMVRMRGFEELARDEGKIGLFLTLTAPSRCHAWKQNHRKTRTFQNPKFDGSSPTQTQRLLCGQWARFRAALAREDIRQFGFRVAEPHHDGTPHWHCLVFINPQDLNNFLRLLVIYFTWHDRAELQMPLGDQLDALLAQRRRRSIDIAMGMIDPNNQTMRNAIRPRVDWKLIDWERGSATGYIAKYIAKNIDGHRVGEDYEAEQSANTTAIAVSAWASTWRIRQFQQVGGPAVSVWRELRRLGDEVVEWDCILEAARHAADTASWRRFVDAMGGIDLPRKQHLVQLSRRLDEAATCYGEDVKRLMGVITEHGQTTAQTRVEGWEIVRKGTQRAGSGLGERSESALSECSEQSLSGASRPRSSVNNCTYGSLSLEKGSALVRELARMGLYADELTLKLLGRGNIVSFDGRYVRLVGDRLIVSQSWPGATDGKASYEHLQHDTTLAAALTRRLAQREAAVRQQVKQAIDTGADIEDLIASLPLELAELALAEATRIIDMAEYSSAYQPSPQEIARCDALCHSNDQHQPTIAEALAERELD